MTRLAVDDDSISATVQGTDTYEVLVVVEPDGEGTRVDARCTCPFFRDSDQACKHIWAAILKTADAGHFQNISEPVRFEQARSTPPLRQPAHPGTQVLSMIEAHVRKLEHEPPPVFVLAGDELMYVFAAPAAHTTSTMQLHVMTRTRNKDGAWTKPKPVKLTREDCANAPEPDRSLLLRLFGGVRPTFGYSHGYGEPAQSEATFGLSDAIAHDLVPAIAATGRAFLEINRRPPAVTSSFGFMKSSAPVNDYLRMRWDEGAPWRFTPIVTEGPEGWRLSGKLTRDPDEWMGLTDVLGITTGFVFTRSTVARSDLGPAAPIVLTLAAGGAVDIRGKEGARLAIALAELGASPETLPEPLRVDRVDVAPIPRLRVRPSNRRADTLNAEVSFSYGESRVPATGGVRTHYDSERRRLITRRPGAELAALNQLVDAGIRQHRDHFGATVFELPARQLSAIVAPLTAGGWVVEGTNGVFRSAGRVKMSVTSGIDWFDLDAVVEFGDASASLTDVLAALTRKESTIVLGDGSVGLLPDEWLARYAPLVATGDTVDGRIRFRYPQAALLDVLLADASTTATVDVDAQFARARDELRRLTQLEAVDAPEGFVGELRDYQREGLSWLQFLQRSGFGGCLADDMGLGKTVMVLALLQGQRADKSARRGPALVIVPRSLVHNWIAEAQRFTPALRVTDYSTTSRGLEAAALADFDVVLATYGTLRQDIIHLKDVAFDYVILDEAQAIKNANTASAKAVRLLKARHRLALTGTPIENHLGELWSLFEFLNPGLLGQSTVFQRAASAAPDPDMINLLARGLRPFMLRRTKQQVARELPAKTEQTITCELSKPERTLYESLRKHYRTSVLARVDRDGVKKSQMHILEALLRLRQAACHPGLVDRTKSYPSSAKLDTVVDHVKEVIEEGHKALVFSQFTSLLALLQAQLDRNGVTYEYLDGKTRNRADRVRRFQEDPACRLFLVSLKAGGLGLNLTAAEYVFLLDPWWNPAVETQAIDRAHRIGQTREVFAYRLVANNTIESKILELQGRKRALADAVLGGGTGALRGLDREDLELLLS